MDMKSISTELAEMNTKIGNYTRIRAAAMADLADQRKLLENINSKIVNLKARPPSTNEIETMRREFTALQENLTEKMFEQKASYENQLAETQSSLRNENETVRREMAEQKKFYENQRAEDRSRAEKAFAGQESKIAKMCKDIEDLQVTMTVKSAEIVEKDSSVTASQVAVKNTIDELKLSFDKELTETRAKTSKVLSSLRGEIQTVRREMAEQKLSYENQLTKGRAETEEALTSLKNKNLTMRLALTGEKARTERLLESQRTEINNIRADFSALQRKLPSENNEHSELCRMDGVLTGYMDPEIKRQINKAFGTCPHFAKTPEKVGRIYRQVKKDLTERPLRCKQTQDLVNRAITSPKVQKMPLIYSILYDSGEIISKERSSQDSAPSMDYVKLLLAVFECI